MAKLIFLKHIKLIKFFDYKKCRTGFSQKNKEKFRKKVHERYQNFSEDDNNKKHKYSHE